MEIIVRQADTEANQNEQSTKAPKKHHIGCFVFVLFILLALGGVAYAFRSYLAIIPTLLHITQTSIPRSKTEQQISYQFTNTKLINILLLGSDNDAKFDPNSVLTQTIIIVSIDPNTNEVNMISIPRDFWVPIAGVSGGYGKIDQASGYGGLALARETVEKDFGVHIDYYAWVGLNGFINVINTFGGIDVDVNHPILDSIYPNDTSGLSPYSAIRLYIPAGPQHLDGVRALEYVRSRHGDLQGDFGRSARQQQILLALATKVETTNIVDKIPNLVNELQGSVRTDMSVIDLTHIATLLPHITPNNIHRYILSPPDYATDGLSPDGKQDVVIPNMAKIDALFSKLFD